MPIKNYTTTVRPDKTAGEIVALLVRKGATTIQQDYSMQGGQLWGITFLMMVNGEPLRFRLPVNVEGVARAILRDKPWTSRSRHGRLIYEQKIREEAKWVAWRILKDWCEAQIAMVESNQADVAQVFLPYAQANNGQTVYQAFLENRQQLALGDGSEVER